jgi:hypothetical protein
MLTLETTEFGSSTTKDKQTRGLCIEERTAPLQKSQGCGTQKINQPHKFAPVAIITRLF